MPCVSSFNFSNIEDFAKVDSKERTAFRELPLSRRLLHPQKKRRLDKEFHTALVGRFATEFNLSEKTTQRAWKTVLASRGIRYSKSAPLSADDLRKIKGAFESALYYHGTGAHGGSEASGQGIASACEYLFGQREDIDSSFLTLKSVKAVLVSKDPELLSSFRQELEKALHTGFDLVSQKKVDENLFEVFVHRMIAFLPYTYPEEGTQVTLPVKVGESWSEAVYTFDKRFSLSPSWFSSPLPAYGLCSEEPGAPPLLAFLGTTYPAGSGFMATLFSDFTPGFSVGHAASLYGKKALEEWLKEKNNVTAVGISLGGSLALHVERQHPQVSQVHAYVPAGDYPWNGSDETSNINIYCQRNDLVSTMGMFPTGDNVSVYRVLGEKNENFLSAHMKAYTGGKEATLLRVSPEHENKRWDRRVLTALHFLGSPIIFTLLLPAHLVGRLFSLFFQAATGKTLKTAYEWQIIAFFVTGIALTAIAATLLTQPGILSPLTGSLVGKSVIALSSAAILTDFALGFFLVLRNSKKFQDKNYFTH